MRRVFALVVLSVVTLVTPAYAASFAVTIQNFMFTPAQLTVSVGDTVTWTNRGAEPHTVRWTSGRTGESALLWQNLSYSTSFTEPGTYTYVCGIHGASMSGSVRVTGTAVTPSPTPTSTPAPTPAPAQTPPPLPPTAPPTPSDTPPPTPTPSPSPSPSPSPTPAPSPTASPSPSPVALAVEQPSPAPLAESAGGPNPLIVVAGAFALLALLGSLAWSLRRIR